MMTSTTHVVLGNLGLGKVQSPQVRTFRRCHSITSAIRNEYTDYQWDTTRPVKGEKRSGEWVASGYANAIMQLAKTVRECPSTSVIYSWLLADGKFQDIHVDSAFWHVRCFLAPPTALLQPSIVAKVLLLKLKQAIGLKT